MATDKKQMVENLLFTQSTQTGPNYTIRALVTDIDGASPKQLKPFSHFTLGCTSNDEMSTILKGMVCLAKLAKNNLCLTIEGVVNLGDEAKPLWALKLKDDAIMDINMRQIFGTLFDHTMCKEKNGVCYLWRAEHKDNLKCPHITVGPKEEDRLLATSLIGKKVGFNYLDYKKVGPHDPHVRIDLVTFNNLVKDGMSELKALQTALQPEKFLTEELFAEASVMADSFLKCKTEVAAIKAMA